MSHRIGADIDGTFTDLSKRSGVVAASGSYPMTAVAADYDNDGWPDIYVACDSTPSWLFRNQRDGTFREEALERGIALSEDGMEQAGMGIGVGDYDQIECVLRSIGIDESEFTSPSGQGAIHLYDNSGAFLPVPNSFEDLLYDPTKLNEYNLVFINCTEKVFTQLMDPNKAIDNLHNYVSSGGRLYTTDWSYDYMEQVGEFSPYVFFEGGGSMSSPQPPHAAAM